MAIKVLPPRIYNRISAGEVVEKPASIVKELVENSLDAGATKVRVEIAEGGIKKISVSDDGCGIEKEDLPLAFLPHATSKIAEVADLDNISTLGFRGEALASIASVCQVSISTKTRQSETGFYIEASGGEVSKIKEIACLDGTTVTTENLFFNTPARAKFLRKPKSEEADITHLIEKFMLARPEVEFVYVVDGKEVYSHHSGALDEVLYLIYGKDVFENLIKLDFEDGDIKVFGYVASPKVSRPNRTYQTLFVNGRFVENFMVSACVQGVYEPFLMKGRFPIYTIKLQMPYDGVDVNVHPSKKEVKFQNSTQVFGVIRRAVEKALVGTNLVAEFEFKNEDEKEWKGFSPENDDSPRRTGFYSTFAEKIQGGQSFKATVSSEKENEKIVSPAEYQKKGIEIINMPDFSTIKGDEKPKNRPGRFYFDQSGDSLLHEVEINVEKNREEKPSGRFEEETFLTNRSEEIKIVGVVFKTYIIAEYKDSIYVIDQHAMHERQLFDKLKAEIEQNNVSKQGLLAPYKVVLAGEDKEIFESRLENLKKIGFEFSFDGKDYFVSAVPFVISGINLEKFIEEVLKEGVLAERTASGLVNEKLCQTACKHAIRAGDSIGTDEILYLIDKINDGVALCPHGRPIVVKITKKELEKMFKRTL